MNVALSDLFTTDIGILSLITIGVVLVIGTYIYFWVKKQIRHDVEAHRHEIEAAKHSH
ncbi:DUF3149 domain-containing protein [Burkholderiaceae bacterium DAT-1]|nr:DUF3149 domain-containing protein [Burkholderiaceae bacterium DAT-1]